MNSGIISKGCGIDIFLFFPGVGTRGVDPQLFQSPGYVNAYGVLADADCFDAAFFNYSPNEADMMDPNCAFYMSVRGKPWRMPVIIPTLMTTYRDLCRQCPNQYWWP